MQMKRKLNPALVNRTPASGRLVNWVILGEPRHPILGPEEGIGPIEIEEVSEAEAESTAFKRQLRETLAGLSARFGVPLGPEPVVVLAKNCFGLRGLVRLIIYSNDPFAGSVSECATV
jgi:hypothetical protein